MTELEASGPGEPPPHYMVFVVVFLFFLTGLLGFLVCHLLKKKGYRCRAGDPEDEDEEEKLGGTVDDELEENQDTVEQILKCIMENEANMEAFNELLGNHNLCVRHDPRLRKESIAGLPPHLHTVHSGTDLDSCHLCAQIRSKRGRRQSRTPRFKQRPGEQTVFSVGRFRVTHTDKKLPGSSTPLAASRDQLDQSQDSDDRRDTSYNLRSMFKDARPAPEGAGPGKRKKSVSIFGLRRGSDPIGMRLKPGAGRELSDFRLALERPPVLPEEQSESAGDEWESHPKPDKADNEKSAGSPAARSEKQLDSNPQPGAAAEANSPDLSASIKSTPGSLPISSERTVNVEDKVLKAEMSDPGPLQTSTPISPLPASAFADRPQARPPKVFSISKSPSELSSGSDVEPGIRLISLGSSPLSSNSGKTLSSASLLRTPTSSPKSGSRNVSQDPNSPASPRPNQRSEALPEPGAAQKTEIRRPGILKTPRHPPASSASAPSDHPSSPPASQTTVVRSGTGTSGGREFSVVTMVELEEQRPPSPAEIPVSRAEVVETLDFNQLDSKKEEEEQDCIRNEEDTDREGAGEK